MLSDGIIAGAKAVYPSSFIYREESVIKNNDEQNQYNQGVDDVVQAIKDLVSENPTDCFAQIVSDLDQIASDLKECET